MHLSALFFAIFASGWYPLAFIGNKRAKTQVARIKVANLSEKSKNSRNFVLAKISVYRNGSIYQVANITDSMTVSPFLNMLPATTSLTAASLLVPCNMSL